MITNISLDGFKSHVKSSLDLCPLTILTGLNSSGKSSIIQALRILERYSKGMEYPLLKGYGNIKDLTNPNVKDWSLSANYDEDKSIRYSTSFQDVDCPIIGYPNIIYISAGRLGPQVSLNIKNDFDLDEKGENVLQCVDAFQNEIIPEVLRHKEAEGNTFLFNLRAWLNTISPDVDFDWEIQKETDSSYSLFNNHRANNVGFGLSYTLPVIVAILMGAINGSVVIIENPEAHLHPRGQVELGSLMVQAIKGGVQVIVETHSDHFFDGIRIAIKEQEDVNFCQKVCAYWFELDNNLNTKYEKCIIDKDGRMPRWPKGMFDQFEVNALKLM